MKKLSLIAGLLMLCNFVFAQLQPGDMIWGSFDKSGANKLYVAEVISVNGKNFTCKFLHSSSTYSFINSKNETQDGTTMSSAIVENNKGGKFNKGTKFYFLLYGPKESDTCEYLKVTFSDGKSYLASYTVKGTEYHLTFLHTNSQYIFSNEGVVIKSGGSYKKGQRVQWICAIEKSL